MRGDGGQAFHVVAPSLPGFGFSPFPDPADPRPWTAARVAVTWVELMARLGYERFGVHGNDAGAIIAPQVALAAPTRVVGVHLTGGIGLPTGDPAELDEFDEFDDADRATIAAAADWGLNSGYGPYLANRPQTLSYGRHDSPVAQLAWLGERWTDFDGWPGADGPVPTGTTAEQLLITATLYWLTGTGASSSWTYYDGVAGLPVDQDLVPTGVSHGGPAVLRTLAQRRNDIRSWSSREAGSHMVAMADPTGLVEDLRAFFGGLST